MRRYPDGADGKAFFQKDAPTHMPDWIPTFRALVLGRARASPPKRPARLDAVARHSVVPRPRRPPVSPRLHRHRFALRSLPRLSRMRRMKGWIRDAAGVRKSVVRAAFQVANKDVGGTAAVSARNQILRQTLEQDIPPVTADRRGVGGAVPRAGAARLPADPLPRVSVGSDRLAVSFLQHTAFLHAAARSPRAAAWPRSCSSPFGKGGR